MNFPDDTKQNEEVDTSGAGKPAPTWASPAEMKKELCHSTHCVQLCSPPEKKRCGQAGECPESGQEDDLNIGKLPCEEKLRELNLLSSWEKKGEVLSLCNYEEIVNPFLQGVTWKRWGVTGTSFSWGYSYCTRFFTMTTVSHQNNLPREVVDSTFKIQLDTMLVQSVLWPRKAGPDGPSGPF